MMNVPATNKEYAGSLNTVKSMNLPVRLGGNLVCIVRHARMSIASVKNAAAPLLARPPTHRKGKRTGSYTPSESDARVE